MPRAAVIAAVRSVAGIGDASEERSLAPPLRRPLRLRRRLAEVRADGGDAGGVLRAHICERSR